MAVRNKIKSVREVAVKVGFTIPKHLTKDVFIYLNAPIVVYKT